MSKIWSALFVLSLVPLGISSAEATGPSVVQQLSGYVCVGLSIDNPPRDPLAPLRPVFAEPSENSAHIALAQATMIAVAPPQLVGGFIKVVIPNKATGWVEASLVNPWHSISLPDLHCHPALMSTGLLGFDYDASK
jgi:hypothetical protein